MGSIFIAKTSSALLTNFKIAAVYSSSYLKLYFNGSLVQSITNTVNTISGLNQLNMKQWWGGTPVEGKVNSLVYWKTALSDSECITLTTL